MTMKLHPRFRIFSASSRERHGSMPGCVQDGIERCFLETLGERPLCTSRRYATSCAAVAADAEIPRRGCGEIIPPLFWVYKATS